MLEVKFYDTADNSLLKFAVIISKSDNKWVFCKHKERNTFEVSGGHREHGESILDTAKRELYEETGAVVYTIEPVCIYFVIVTANPYYTATFSFTFGNKLSYLYIRYEKSTFFLRLFC